MSGKSARLEDQAASTALYSARPEKVVQRLGKFPLDGDNKLSSAGAAMSLKYAAPRDLPSYPSVGLTNPDSSAGAAASLANANHTDFESWKPVVSVSAHKAAFIAKDHKPTVVWHSDPSEPANKAAKLAKDYKPSPPWHPETSSAGSKAAKIAAADGVTAHIRHSEADLAGTSVAEQAMRVKGLVSPAYLGYTADESKKALLAATGAMSSSRKRSESSPMAKASYPDSENSSANALSAANIANRAPSTLGKSKTQALRNSKSSLDGGKIHSAAVTNLSREMYSSHPPVAPEVEEMNRQAGLRAAAVSMAKQIYEVQQRAIERATVADMSDSQHAASSVHNRKASLSSEGDPHQSPQQYVNLQEAAQKLAAERLAKLQDEHAAYKNYYGTGFGQSRLSLRGLQRRRASSDGKATEFDGDRSKKILSEMSLFNSKFAQVDATKCQKDREALMAVAQRNVKASMHGIDEKVYSETGKVSPAMLQSWEDQAHARAEADSKARLTKHGMINIGGGKYLDQSEIDAIAAQKVQPTLDEISEKVKKQKARDEQLRQEEQERNKNAASRAQDDRERNLRTKEDWKRFRDEENREAKEKKNEEKMRKAKEKQLRDKEKRKSRNGSVEASPQPLEVPALDPIPRLEPITASRFPLLADTRTKIPDESAVAESLAEEDRSKSVAKVFKEPNVHSIDSSIRHERRLSESMELNRVLAEQPIQFDQAHDNSECDESEFGEKRQLELPTRASKDETVADGEETLADSPLQTNDAEIIAARVISLPVLSNTTSDIIPSTNTDNISSIESRKVSANVLVRGENLEATLFGKPCQTHTRENSEPSTILGRKETAEDRDLQIISTTKTTLSGPPLEPKSPKDDSIASWLKSKFSRRTSKPAKPDGQDLQDVGANPQVSDAAHTAVVAEFKVGSNIHNADDSSSLLEVVMVGNDAAKCANNKSRKFGTEIVSDPDNSKHSVSASEEKAKRRPKFIRAETGSSVGEEFEEARDHFDSEKLAGPAFSQVAGRESSSPIRDSRFQENL